MAEKKAKKVEKAGRRAPFAVRVSSTALAENVPPVKECESMLAKLAKTEAGLPANVTRANSRMIVLNVGGKKTAVNPNGLASLWGLEHHTWLPYVDGEGKTKEGKAVVKAQAEKAASGKLYHYRTLLTVLAKKGYTVSLSKDTADVYLAGVVGKAKAVKTAVNGKAKKVNAK